MPCPMKVEVPPFAKQFQRVDSYAEINEVMRSPDFRLGGSRERFLFNRGSILLLDGEEHLKRKAMLSTLFTRDAMVAYETKLLDPRIDEIMRELKAERGADGLARVDFVPLVRSMLLRIAAQVTGIDGIDTPERTERFHVLLDRLSEAISGQMQTGDPEDVVKNGLITFRTLIDEFLHASLERRRGLVKQYNEGALAKDDLPRDLLTLLCLHGQDSFIQEGDTPYDRYVWREACFFLNAATSTTTLSLPHVILHLHDWVRLHPEDIDKLTDAGFLRMAVAESLRMHQTAPVKFRVANSDLTLSTGRKVAKDETLALYAPLANYEEGLFGTDPETFNPYRKPTGNVQNWGMTFGAGVHMCLGRSLVTGVYNRPSDSAGTEGTMVKILKELYSKGLELDPDRPPQRSTTTYNDVYDSVPIILRKL